MNIDLEFAELHNPLFLAGTNLQLKLDPTKRTGLKLVYDRAEKELLVSYNGRTAIVPTTNVASMTPAEKQPPAVLKEQLDAVAAVVAPAQVSSPQAHVFAGPGKGKK